ncbi:MAG: helix-turn-helix domain-containing protein [Bradyrhizobium sp.]|uniref:helix-turn-helix domain-containing protein n=1 Tax=Bradyrhizobium sp. TaxID=376 RepID=UPI0025C1FA46|nr:helix-turn-helix domain-containing protein [Bradyrhizobium sp.]MBI5260871.1 helix-turn-helix domain-containing protein [Bradyrhizobium sp.]
MKQRNIDSTIRKRIKIAAAASILGLSARTVRDMAQLGQIPGAAKPRGIWTFDVAALEDYVRSSEDQIRRRAEELRPRRVVSVALSSSGFRRPGRTPSEHYSEVIERMRRLANERLRSEREN